MVGITRSKVFFFSEGTWDWSKSNSSQTAKLFHLFQLKVVYRIFFWSLIPTISCVLLVCPIGFQEASGLNLYTVVPISHFLHDLHDLHGRMTRRVASVSIGRVFFADLGRLPFPVMSLFPTWTSAWCACPSACPEFSHELGPMTGIPIHHISVVIFMTYWFGSLDTSESLQIPS